LGLTAGATRSSGGSGSSLGTSTATSSVSGGSVGRTRNNFSVEGSASWDLDVWGRIRRQVESNVAEAQASAADVASARLSAQGSLATYYFQLRGEDSLQILLDQTVKAYERSLQITQNQYGAGTAARSDVVAAQALLESTRSSAIAVAELRSQYEHAIAVLTGHAPSELTIAPGALTDRVPIVPPGLPSTLLQRRPDVAAAERTMQQENALIGVAVAAYYPDISLSALYGYSGDPLRSLISVANRVWSLGASASETLFDGGARSSAVRAAQATYDQSVATYRQTVLTAFQQVEDELVALRVLEQQAVVQDRAVDDIRKAVVIALNQYRAGTVAYTTVITEQEQALTNEQTALTIRQNRMVASVALIQALGGGWDAAALPEAGSLHTNPLVP
jgi:NodT family efflux transporter outer membrane factor (OMF) lipoprotein